MNKYTPGPWLVEPTEEDSKYAVFDITTPEWVIATIWEDKGNDKDEEAIDNAYLIAAAPEMYELLKDFTTLNPSVASVARELNKRALDILSRIEK